MRRTELDLIHRKPETPQVKIYQAQSSGVRREFVTGLLSLCLLLGMPALVEAGGVVWLKVLVLWGGFSQLTGSTECPKR